MENSLAGHSAYRLSTVTQVYFIHSESKSDIL